MKSLNRLICLVFYAAIFILCPSFAHCETTNAVFKFYTVSETAIEGGRYIDTPEFPRLGYIATNSLLTITQLKRVFEESPPDVFVTIVLLPDDAKRFQEMTKNTMGTPLLVTFGDKPVKYVNMNFPQYGDLILFELPNKAERDKVEAEYKKLVKKPAL